MTLQIYEVIELLCVNILNNLYTISEELRNSLLPILQNLKMHHFLKYHWKKKSTFFNIWPRNSGIFFHSFFHLSIFFSISNLRNLIIFLCLIENKIILNNKKQCELL